MNQYILGISGWGDFHDNSAVFVSGQGRVVFAGAEERFSRIKHDPRLPLRVIKSGLKFARIRPDQIKAVATGWPRRKWGAGLIAALIISGIRGIKFWPKVWANHRKKYRVKSVPGWLKQKHPAAVDHYRAHANSAYFTSGFDRALVVVLDGFGPDLSGRLFSGGVYLGQKNHLQELAKVPLAASLGLFYEAVTNALGFTPADGEGKTMGLAAYGRADQAYPRLKPLAPRFAGGRWQAGRFWPERFWSVSLDYKPIFQNTHLSRELTGLISRFGRENVAAAAQKIVEEEGVNFVRYLIKQYGANNLAVAGGVFLNVKLNRKLAALKGVEDFFVQPNCGDGGVALGAALELVAPKINSRINSVAWGESFTDREVARSLKRYGKKLLFIKQPDIAAWTAHRLAAGKVVGWFQGREEWGPRALGQRSVLADPREIQVKNRINNLMKQREYFMPFAPSLLEEAVKDYLVAGKKAPFMTLALAVKPGMAKKIQAAIHIDHTARPNTVNQQDNPLYWRLIKEFEHLTGVGAVLNTSFNKHGLPIVNQPTQAIEHLLWGCVDELAIGSYWVRRRDEA